MKSIYIKELGLEIRDNGEVLFEGHLCLTNHKRYVAVSILAHRLIARAFHGSPTLKSHVCHHKDGNPRNNAIHNLEWISQSDNCKIHRHYSRKLTVKQVRTIYHLKPVRLPSLKQMAREFGVSYATVTSVRCGYTWNTGWRKTNGSKLTAEQIERIRNWSAPKTSSAQLSRQYRCHDTLILAIWKCRNVEDACEQFGRH